MEKILERSLADIAARLSHRKLFIEYDHPFDHERPFGPDNVGPYFWQVEFHNNGVNHPERCLLAANQVGKSRTGGAEVAIHLTGEYPSWWTGKRFDHPIIAWTGAENTQDSRDIIQNELLGARGEEGTGWIPKSRIDHWDYQQAGVREVVESIFVKHKSGGMSQCILKTYAQEARGWRGRRIHVCWVDELCPMDIYTEALTRLLKNNGIMISTFTPMEGPSDVVRHFLEKASEEAGIYYKNVTWDDAPHLDAEAKKRLRESYPEWERDARTKGIPMLGSGAIFPIADERIMVDPFPIPDYWPRINGVDFGVDHPAAGAFCALDPDGDIFYLYDGYKMPGETPVYHGHAMGKHGKWIRTAWPHDGIQSEKSSNVKIKDEYRKHGVSMLREHAHYGDERGNSLNAALHEMYEYMRLGQFKVFSNCRDFFEEKRMFHRKDHKVVALHDDLISAARYAFMMRRYATVKPITVPRRRGPSRPIIGG